MQVKIFKHSHLDIVEKFINKFIQSTPNIIVIDIKLSHTDITTIALIMYRTN